MPSTTVTGIIYIGAGVNSSFDVAYAARTLNAQGNPDDYIDIPATAKSSATLHVSVVNKGGWLKCTYDGSARSSFKLCNSSRTKYIEFWSKGLVGTSAVDQSSDFTKTVDISVLRGERLYGWVQNISPGPPKGGVVIWNRLWFELTYEYGNPVTKGNKILNSDIAQTGVYPGVGTIISNSHFSRGTKAEASTFNSQVLGI